MYVSDYMTPTPQTVIPDASMGSVRRSLVERHYRHLPVVDEKGVLLGMVTDRDIRSAYPSSLSRGHVGDAEIEKVDRTPVSEIMSRKVVSLPEFATIDDALILFDGKKVGALPVVDAEGVVVGIFSIRDLLQAYRKLFGLGEKGSSLVAVKDDGNKRPLTRIAHVLEEHDIHFSRLVRVKADDKRSSDMIYIRVNTFNIHSVHKALEEAGFMIGRFTPQP